MDLTFEKAAKIVNLIYSWFKNGIVETNEIIMTDSARSL